MGALQAEQNAKAQAAIAKAAQADMTQEEKLSAYKQTAGYIARQESNAEYERQKALEAQRAGERNAVAIAEEYKKQEQAKQNAVGAARWAGVASVAKGKQDSEEENKTWLQKAWENTKTFIQEKIVEPVTTFWNEKIYEPYIQPATQWVQENIIQPVITFWNEKVYKPYIQPVVTWVNENIVEPVKTVFQENPIVAWGTAAVVTTATIAGTVYYIDCYGTPSFTPPVSSLVNFAGMFSLPITGWLTTSRKKRVYGVLVGMLMLGMLLSACGGGVPGNTATPTNTLCPPTAVQTETATVVPPAVTPDLLKQLNSAFLPDNSYAMPFLVGWINEYNLTDQAYEEFYNQYLLRDLHYTEEQINALNMDAKALIVWQNYYNQEILKQAQIYGLDPAILKGQMLVESNGAPDPGGPCPDAPTKYCRNSYPGLMQIGSGEIANVLGGAPEDMLEKIVALYINNGGPCPQAGYGGCNHASQALPPFFDGKGLPLYASYSAYYKALKNDPSYADFNALALRMVDGQCLPSDTSILGCTTGAAMIDEGFTSIQIAAAINEYNSGYLQQKIYNEVNPDAWNLIPQDVKYKIIIAAYNGGADGIGHAVVDTLNNSNGQAITWADVTDTLEQGKTIYTSNWCQAVVYPDNAACYGNGGNNCVIQPVQTDPNTGECKE